MHLQPLWWRQGPSQVLHFNLSACLVNSSILFHPYLNTNLGSLGQSWTAFYGWKKISLIELPSFIKAVHKDFFWICIIGFLIWLSISNLVQILKLCNILLIPNSSCPQILTNKKIQVKIYPSQQNLVLWIHSPSNLFFWFLSLRPLTLSNISRYISYF